MPLTTCECWQKIPLCTSNKDELWSHKTEQDLHSTKLPQDAANPGSSMHPSGVRNRYYRCEVVIPDTVKDTKRNYRCVFRCHTALHKASLRCHLTLNSGRKTSTPVLLSELYDASIYLNIAVIIINVPLHCLWVESTFSSYCLFNSVKSTEASGNNQGCVRDNGTVVKLYNTSLSNGIIIASFHFTGNLPSSQTLSYNSCNTPLAVLLGWFIIIR